MIRKDARLTVVISIYEIRSQYCPVAYTEAQPAGTSLAATKDALFITKNNRLEIMELSDLKQAYTLHVHGGTLPP